MDVNWKQVIAVTNRHLCEGDFLRQVERVASLGVRAVILREKDLSPAEYTVLAEQVMKICETYGVSCILHKYVQAAQTLGCPNLHLPRQIYLNCVTGKKKNCFISSDSSELLCILPKMLFWPNRQGVPM
ncbi:MAG: thiamine phosphate synthase [Eubacterium sp.]